MIEACIEMFSLFHGKLVELKFQRAILFEIHARTGFI